MIPEKERGQVRDLTPAERRTAKSKPETPFDNVDAAHEYVDVGPHLWGLGAMPDPAMQPPAGEAVGKYLRTLRNNFSYVVVDASADYTDLALA